MENNDKTNKVVKETIKKETQKLKTKIKKVILMTLIKLLPFFIVAIILAGIISGIKDKMITLMGGLSKVGGFFTQAWQWLTNDYWTDISEGIEYVVDAKTGETLGTEDSIKQTYVDDKTGYIYDYYGNRHDENGNILNENGEIRELTTRSYTLVDQYTRELGNNGVSIKELRLLGDANYEDYDTIESLLANEENKKLVEKYMAEFIRADIITQQPHRNRTEYLVNPNNQNLVDGGVYFYRNKKSVDLEEEDFQRDTSCVTEKVEEKDYVQMKYLTPEEFVEKLGKNGADITELVESGEIFTTNNKSEGEDLRYYFTINPKTENMVLLEFKTISTKEGNTNDGWFEGLSAWFQRYKDVYYEMRLVEKDYKALISKYTMPYEFLINLCEITQNPEFVYHVALLARDTKINLAIQDNTDQIIEIQEKETYNREQNLNTGEVIQDETSRDRKIVSTVTNTPVIRPYSANTWSFYESFEYTKTIETERESTGIKESSAEWFEDRTETIEINTGGADLEAGTGMETRTYNYKVKFNRTIKEETQTITTKIIYNEATLAENESVEKSKQFLGLLINKTGKCSHDCSYDEVSIKQNPIALSCARDAEFDDVKKETGKKVTYRIPNMTITEAPYNKLMSGLQMLYAALQSNSTGYNESDKLLTTEEQIKEKYSIQEQYMEEKDYEKAYVVKMQGLVEHLKYLMTLPDNESYTIKDIILGYIIGDDDDDYEDIIVDEGTIASAREIYEFLIGKGFTPESACAILGNIQQESGFRTGASNGTHFGLCQWGDGRWEALRQFAEQRGTSWTDLDTQLEFLWSELCGNKTDVKNAIINSTDIYDSTDVFCRKFEICGNYGIEVPRRYKYAQYWYSIFVLGNDANCAELERFFPNGIPQTEAEMQKYLVTITVPINNKDGSKGSKSVRVHKDVANDVLEIFKQIQESGFKAYDIQGYSWRSTSTGTGTRSHHSYGLAIDINVKENYCIKNGKVIAGEFWRPDKNEYSIRANGPVVKAFESRGWTWGGNWKSSKDYMHFSVTGK